MKTLLLPLLLVATPVLAQEHCPATVPFVGFENRLALTASSSRPAALPVLAIGRAAAVALAPAGRLALETSTDHAAAPGSFDGMLALRISRAGLYRIGLDGRAWIDVVRGGKAIASAAHAHGPACGPVRKIVDFHLDAGVYTVQLSDAAKPVVTIMAAPAT